MAARRHRPRYVYASRAPLRAPIAGHLARPDRPAGSDLAHAVSHPPERGGGRRTMLGDDRRDVMDVLPREVSSAIGAVDAVSDLGIGQNLQGLRQVAQGLLDVGTTVVMALVGSDDLAHSPYQESEWHREASKAQQLAEGAQFGGREERDRSLIGSYDAGG